MLIFLNKINNNQLVNIKYKRHVFQLAIAIMEQETFYCLLEIRDTL